VSKDLRAGGAYVELYGIDEKLSRTLNAAQAKLRAFVESAQKGLKSYGKTAMIAGGAMQAATLGPIAAAVLQFSGTGDALDKMSARTGIAADTLSALGFAAEQSGASLDSVEKGLVGLVKFNAALEKGSRGAADVLSQLGVHAEEFAGMNSEEQFAKIADHLMSIEDPGRRASLVMSIFGKSGRELLPLLNGGSAGIKALTDEARKLGFVMSEEDVKSAAELNDSLNRVKRTAEGVTLKLGAALAPAITAIMDAAAPLLAQATAWIEQNRQLIVQIAGVAAGVMFAGTALVGLGAILYGTSVGLGVLAGAGSAALAALSALAGVVAFAFSPAGLAVAAVAGGVYLLFQAVRENMPQISGMLGGFSGLWETIRSESSETFEAITAALKSGDMTAAAEILWLQLESIWMNGSKPLRETWYAVRDTMVRGLISATAAIESAWVNMTTNMLQVWNSMQVALLPLITSVQNTLASYIAQAGEALGIFGEGTSETLQEDQQRRAGDLAKRLAALQAQNDKLETDRQSALKAIQQAADTDRDTVANRTAEQQAEITRKMSDVQSRLNAVRTKAIAEGGQKKKLDQTATSAQQGLASFESKANNTAIELGSVEALRAIIAATRGGRTIESELAKQTELAEEQADALASIDGRLKHAPTLAVERVA
jgi:hypothetical protein